MKSVTLVTPGPITTRTGGSIYDRHIADGLRARGWTVTIVELEAFAHPLAPPLERAPAQFAAIPDHQQVLVDGLAFGTMPEIIEKESWRLQFIPIVHMALWTTPGLTRGEAAWLHNLERRAMTRARHIVITGMPSLAHVRALTDDFDHNRVTRIPPGVDAVGWAALKGRPYGLPGAPAAGSRASDGPLHLLCVANLTWGKGYDVLLRALAQLADQEWTLTCVGSADRDPQYAASLKELAHTLGLERRIDWIGEVMGDPEGVSLRSADLFLLPTRGETYGMAVAEAIAHGLPVVSTRTGEIPSIVGEGGRLVEADDVEAFASAVRKVMSDAALRRQLAEGARAAATRLPTWEHAADAFDRVLSTVAR